MIKKQEHASPSYNMFVDKFHHRQIRMGKNSIYLMVYTNLITNITTVKNFN